VELSKLKKSLEELIDMKEIWCYFLRESANLTREDPEYLSGHKEMGGALKHFDNLVKDPGLESLAWDKLKSEIIYSLDRKGLIEEGIEKGREEGIKKEKIQVILNMFREGFDISVISKVTGLSEKEVKKINNEA